MAKLALAPQPQAPQFHDITVVSTKKYACARVMAVPPEEFGIEKNARSIKDANYCFHDINTKTEGDLIAEGYDEDQVRALPGYTGSTDIETLARDSASEHDLVGPDINRASRIVAITEHYIRLDYEQNGQPGLYMVITGRRDGQVLRKDGKDCVYPIDYIPFAAATPIPITHRFVGRSIADQVIDIQKVKTALLRGALDNLYLHNNPRAAISEAHAGPNTIDDYLTVRQGAPIRMKMPGGIEWQTVPDITGSVYPMMQYQDAMREQRTGMSQQSQGLDANALQNQSATAVAQVFTASQMRLKLVVRMLAEGVRDMCWLLHATIRKHGQQTETVNLTGGWVDVNPREWKSRDHLTVQVGLGTGDKPQQYAQLMGIGNVQKELLMGGKGHMVPDQQLYNSATDLVRLTGRKDVDRYFADPSARDPQTGQLLNPPQPPAPDPKLQVEQQKAQNDLQLGQQKMQLAAQQSDADAKHQLIKTQADIALAQQKAKLDAEIAMLEAKLKQDQAQREAIMHEQQMQHDRERHQLEMQKSGIDMLAKTQAHDQGIAAGKQKMESDAQDNDRSAKAAKLTPQVEKLSQKLDDHIAATKKPKKAKKLPDGSWVVEPVG